jgi:hypothetical protein
MLVACLKCGGNLAILRVGLKLIVMPKDLLVKKLKERFAGPAGTGS